MKIREVFDECGLRILNGEEAFYFIHDKNGNLDGMVSSHVDDFIFDGIDIFLKDIMGKITEKLEISKLEDNEFIFTGMDVKKEGKIWKLKKPLYGLNDVSRKFWLKVREVFDECGLRILDGDEVFYFRHDKNGNFDGMVSSHLDDFILARIENFLEEITRKLAE